MLGVVVSPNGWFSCYLAERIKTTRGALEASYSIYRDGMEGKLARVALSFLSIFGGLVIFCLYQAEILAWLYRTRTQKEDNRSDGA